MPFEEPTNEFPVIFPISLLEEDFGVDFISGKTSEKFLVQATLVTMEVDAEGNLITSGTTSVFAAEWPEPVSPSGRQRRGSATQTDPGRGGTIYDGFFDLKLVECPPSE
jgi:hypothetical protein